MSAIGKKRAPEGVAEADAAITEARAVVNAIQDEAARGELRWDSGVSGERLRGLAFRVMVLAPIRRWWRRRRERRARRQQAMTLA
jgi:hypothetical protein